MDFWITISIIIFIITLISAYGSYLGLYGKDTEEEE